ncbi:MAG: alpha/beta hydrolase [SAR202 cluster bacterium]|nr:alpha/beta hydrolase [SAR202 cluster bacterium]
MELTVDPTSRGLTEEEIIHISGLSSHWVRLANGSLAHYVVSGDTGPKVILLHGGIVGSSGTAGWRFMAPFLGAHGFRVYCPDQPGFGWADTGPTGRRYLEMGPVGVVEFINDFANAIGADQFFLGGNSMGCINTVNYTVAHPERVKGMFLIAGGFGDIVDPAKRIPPKDGRFTPNPAYQTIPFDGTEKSMRDLMMGIIYKASAVWPELATMRTKAANRQAEATKIRMAAAERFQKEPNLVQLVSTKHRLKQLTVPGIYLYGVQDVLLPVENGFMQEDVGFDHIQFFYPDECGHQGQTDQPEMFNQAALEFFRDGKVSWKTAQWAGVSRRKPINPNLVQEPGGGFRKPDPNFYEQFTREAKAKKAATSAG